MCIHLELGTAHVSLVELELSSYLPSSSQRYSAAIDLQNLSKLITIAQTVAAGWSQQGNDKH